MKQSPASGEIAWSNDRLVRECRKGNQAAWSALIDKYKNLIFSIPIKLGISRDDAADIFQSVCLDLLSGLLQLREPEALPKWLMQASYHKSLRWKKQSLNFVDSPDEIADREGDSEALPEAMLYQLQREQLLREAIVGLSARCQRMLHLLFFEDPPRPYDDIAGELGLATGSIGFIRGRCLKQLREQLETAGFL